MATEFLERCQEIEECYEFMLAYAGQGLPSEEGSSAGSQIRGFLQRGERALTNLAAGLAHRSVPDWGHSENKERGQPDNRR